MKKLQFLFVPLILAGLVACQPQGEKCPEVDVDKERQVARSFRVRGLPATVLLTRNGDQVGPMPGFIPPKSYLAMLNKILEQS